MTAWRRSGMVAFMALLATVALLTGCHPGSIDDVTEADIVLTTYDEATTYSRGFYSRNSELIEIKEGCDISAPSETVARISYQRFFSRYLQLSGMTGTASEAAAELQFVYNLKVVRIPTHRPSRLTDLKTQLLPTLDAKWQALVARIRAVHQQGRPILVGTRTLEDSERISQLLASAGLKHRVLNARQDEEEAELISNAGNRGSITIATNMAGRGTDIPLGPGVEILGGLHVIAVERNEARRIDRQLYGRCARQGDPGSFESILCLEDDILRQNCPKYMRNMAANAVRNLSPVAGWKSRVLIAICQFESEARLRSRRRALERMEAYLGKILSFAGQQE